MRELCLNTTHQVAGGYFQEGEGDPTLNNPNDPLNSLPSSFDLLVGDQWGEKGDTAYGTGAISGKKFYAVDVDDDGDYDERIYEDRDGNYYVAVQNGPDGVDMISITNPTVTYNGGSIDGSGSVGSNGWNIGGDVNGSSSSISYSLQGYSGFAVLGWD